MKTIKYRYRAYKFYSSELLTYNIEIKKWLGWKKIVPNKECNFKSEKEVYHYMLSRIQEKNVILLKYPTISTHYTTTYENN